DRCASTTVCATTAKVGTSLTAVVNVKDSAFGYPSHRRDNHLTAPIRSRASPRSSGDVVMKKRLNDVSRTRNLRVRAIADKYDPVNRLTTKINAERKTPALSDRAHLLDTFHTSSSES